jgi:hypothetical protein
MVSEIPGSNPLDNSGSYHAKYPLNDTTYPVWKKFWEQLFSNKELSHDEVCQMTDTFLDFTSREMGQVLAHALKVQKANNKAMETGEAPDPV